MKYIVGVRITKILTEKEIENVLNAEVFFCIQNISRLVVQSVL